MFANAGGCGNNPRTLVVRPRGAHQGLMYLHNAQGGTMNLTISGHHLEVTPALREYVANKLERITRHFDQVVDIRVLLTIDNQTAKDKRQRAECTIRVKGSDLHAQSAQQDMYAAIDDLMDKLDRQIVRYKDKLQSHQVEAHKRTQSPELNA